MPWLCPGRGGMIDIMLATARVHDAAFWTQDADFAGMEDVPYGAAG